MPKDKSDKQQAIDYLKKILPKGTRVYTKLDHVSSSGMSRVISLYVPAKQKLNGKTTLYIESLNFYAAIALDKKLDKKHGGIKVNGCGMDMGYHLVYSLARVVHGDGYAFELSWL